MLFRSRYKHLTNTALMLGPNDKDWRNPLMAYVSEAGKNVLPEGNSIPAPKGKGKDKGKGKGKEWNPSYAQYRHPASRSHSSRYDPALNYQGSYTMADFR